MRYMKKIDVIPVDDNGGKIIDSFGTSDNHRKNAPSLEAVEKRTDNNLLFNGWFANGLNGVSGWTVERSPGSAAAYAFGYLGLSVTTGFVGTLISPAFSPISRLGGHYDGSYSITIKYRLSGTDEIKTGVAEGIFDILDNDVTVVDDGDILVKLVGPIQQNCKFRLQISAYNNVFIVGVKLEKHEKASDFTPYGKDAGINEMIQTVATDLQALSSEVSDIQKIKIMSWGAGAASIPAGGYSYLQGVIEDPQYTSGYTSKGIINVNLICPYGGVVVSGGFNVFTDTSDGNKRKARVMVYNPLSSAVTVQAQVTILYTKN